MRASALLMTILALSAAGCVTQHQHYNWGSYDPSLYDYYKNPTKVGQLSVSLQAVIDAADHGNAVVPPGIYAEYGYLQMQQGKNQNAVALFRQEEIHWPESKVFMEHMISVASMPVVGTVPSSVTP